MSRPLNEERLFISTTPGLEPALELELRGHRLSPAKVPGGAEVGGPAGLHRRLNLQLRTASRVLLRLVRFSAPDLGALGKGLRALDLSPYRSGGAPLEVSASTHRSRLSHGGVIRDAACRLLGARAAEGEEAADGPLLLQLRVEDDLCTVSLDTSGELLYRRGYRQEISRAPLRETLAAGVLELAGYRGDEPLWDPMCGSGTFAIEAALRALDRAPGIARSFAFERFPSFDRACFESEKAEARRAERGKPSHPIWATDLNAGALGTARRNARRAGVFEHLTLSREDVRAPAALPQLPHGLLVTNPPYGMRVGEAAELDGLYAALGGLLRERLPGWRGAILVPQPRLERALGAEPEDAFELDNGGVHLRLLLLAPARALR